MKPINEWEREKFDNEEFIEMLKEYVNYIQEMDNKTILGMELMKKLILENKAVNILHRIRKEINDKIEDKESVDAFFQIFDAVFKLTLKAGLVEKKKGQSDVIIFKDKEGYHTI